jgi:hypothetical protein
VATCIFCSAVLGRTTKPEHILPNALGGKKSTIRVVCSGCNNTFGSGIDKVLVEQFAGLRNLLQLRSGTGSPPPARKKVRAGNDIVDIQGDGRITLAGKPFTITSDTDGRTQLQISGNSLAEIEAMIPNMAAALKIPEDRLRELISTTAASSVERRPDPIQLEFVFGGLEAFRSAAKSCLVLWATVVGNDEMRKPHYDEVRRYINGSNDGFLGEGANLDSRILEASDEMMAAYGPAFSLLYVKSNEAGRVVGHFTIFNMVAFSVVISKSGGTANRQIALISNPLSGAWSDLAAEKFNVPFEWLDNPHYDYSDMLRSRQRFVAIMDYYVKTSTERELGRIVGDVTKRLGLKEDQEVPQEMFFPIFHEVAHRVTHHLFNIPYSKLITADQMRAAFGDKKSPPE